MLRLWKEQTLDTFKNITFPLMRQISNNIIEKAYKFSLYLS